MPHCNPTRRTRQIESLRAQFAQADGLPFADVLSAQRLEAALREENALWREQLYTPALTLWTFLAQLLSPDRSCRAAVARLMAWLVGQGQTPCSPRTDPYCKARRRLPTSLLSRLARETGQTLHRQAADGWRWHGRAVKLVDGSTLSMPDTPANQHAYPQNPTQAAGLGFPLARVVVVFCLACGAAVTAALGRYQGKATGENSLLRALADALQPGDVLLADRYYGGWFDLALAAARQVDAVLRLHHSRRADFRRGRRLAVGDHVVRWPRPQRPDWMDGQTYAGLPRELAVREVAVAVRQPGFRTRRLVVVTTLLDAGQYSASELGGLYRARWQAELDLRSLKVTLGMDVLRCKSPEMVEKEFWGHLLVYNLIRTTLAQAAVELGVAPRQLSFTAGLQAVRAFGERLLEARGPTAAALRVGLVRLIGQNKVGDRPDRVEPRARKRRPKDYPHLNRPRQQARTGHASRG